MTHTELIAKLRKYKPQSGYAWNCYAAAAAIEQLENALRLVMDCAGGVQAATDAELEAALSCGDQDTEKQANAWLVARAALTNGLRDDATSAV